MVLSYITNVRVDVQSDVHRLYFPFSLLEVSTNTGPEGIAKQSLGHRVSGG